MTLRSSSWVNLTENAKRRIWQWCVAVFLFIILSVALFVVCLMSMDEARYIMDYAGRAREAMLSDAQKYANMFIGVSSFKIVLTTLFAVLSAFGGFSYINDKVKLDFYQSMPQKKGDRFLVIWINSILMFCGSYIVGTVLSFVVLFGAGYKGVYLPEEAFIGFVYMLLYFIGVYALFVLAMMLTGTTFAGVCAFIILSVYEVVLRGLIGLLRNMFFKYNYLLENYYTPIISPYGIMYKLMDILSGNTDVSFVYFIEFIIFDIITILAGYILYMKRPTEMAGRTLIFKKTAMPLKILISVPVILTSALATATILHRSRRLNRSDSLLIIVICILAAIIVCSVIQSVFEQDIRAALRYKFHWIISVVISLLLFFGFKEDILRIDSSVPAASKVESAVFVPIGYDDIYGHIDENLRYIDDDDFYLKYMYIKDVSKVCELSRLSIKKYDEFFEAAGDETDISNKDDPDKYFSSALVMFRLKSGRLITKQIYVPVKDSDAIWLTDKIMSSSDFINGYYSVEIYDGDEAVDNTSDYNLSARYTDGPVYQVLTKEELKELIRLYKKDMEKFSYKERLNELPVGYVDFCLDEKNIIGRGGYGISSVNQTLTLYPGMTNCMEYINGKGYNNGFPLEEIASEIIITNYHYKEQEEYAKEKGMDYLPDDMAEDFIKSHVYEPSYMADGSLADNDFRLIATQVYPNERGYYRWDGGKDFDRDYEVVVNYKNRKLNQKYNMYYMFIEGEIPETVINDLSL
ncbi:MAG: DUF6449 domain-containing protein [Lachnospiraceae bacterium]|nr:DUF6449 domain-containing protein [Lachnospiraceae bacterium]